MMDYSDKYLKYKNKYLQLKKLLDKQTGGTEPTDSFKLMTFNIEVLLNLFDWNATILTNSTVNETRKNDFLELFNNVDVLCLQECGIQTDTNQLKINLDNIKDLSKVADCTASPLAWERSKFSYGDDSFLGNAIYVKENFINTNQSAINIPLQYETEDSKEAEENKEIIIKKIKIPKVEKRCMAFYKLENNITVASVHLFGGRFEDIRIIEYIMNGTFKDHKKEQLEKIIKINPDIICGDFNTKFRRGDIVKSTDIWKDSLILQLVYQRIHNIDELRANEIIKKLKPEQKKDIINKYWDESKDSIWNNYIYMGYYDELLKKAGYKSIYESPNDIIDTTMFRGVVDFIYYKTAKLDIKTTPKIINIPKVMEQTNNYDEETHLYKYTKILSDHFPVWVEFQKK